MTSPKKIANALRGMLTLLIALLLMSSEAGAVTPAEAFEKGRSKIAAAKALSADFTMKLNGRTLSGKLYSKGKKFSLTSEMTSSWYNGKDLYTYDSSTGDTYVFNPTSSELAETNPLLYLSTASDYKVTGSKTARKGVETVVLLPKKSGSSVKSVSLELDPKTYLPKSITVRPASGAAVTVNISNLKLNGDINDATFEYPKKKYPKARLVDMR